MPAELLNLPYELLLHVIEQEDFEVHDLNSLLRCNHALMELLTPSLHKIAATQIVGYGKSVLIWSSERGYARQISSLIEQGSDIEAKDLTYQTPLIKATVNGHLEVVRVLLEKGANTVVSAGRYIDDGTALHVAAREGHVEIVKLLLEFGADIEAKASRGARPLHWAVEGGNKDVVRVLLEKNADINVRRDYDQETPLKLTPENEDDNIFELLIENGADINIRGRLKETVLLQAVAKERTGMVKKLLEKGANIFTCNEYNDTALHLAVTYVGGDEIARLLLDNNSTYPDTWGRAYINTQNDEGDTPLHSATRDEGRRKRIDVGKVIRQLEEEYYGEMGIDPNEMLADPDTAVSNIQASAERNLTAFVRLLLERGADPKCTNGLGRTPLHNAAANGYLDMARLLLDYGAVVDIEDIRGYTPLSRAAKVFKVVRRNPGEACGRIEVMKLLLEHGADPRHKDGEGVTIGELAKGNKVLAEFLGDMNCWDHGDEKVLEGVTVGELAKGNKVLAEFLGDMNCCDHGDEKALDSGLHRYPIPGDGGAKARWGAG